MDLGNKNTDLENWSNEISDSDVNEVEEDVTDTSESSMKKKLDKTIWIQQNYTVIVKKQI